jgi:glycosyltransferase involved in cell wall biosynthesis
MNILYDISVLGIGHHTPRARTGIFRVIENLACELSKSNECNLTFCTTGSLIRLLQVLDYLECNYELSETRFIYSEKYLSLNRNYHQRYFNLTQKIEYLTGQRKFYLKIFRKLFSYTSALNNFFYKSIPDDCLNDFDVFHSPFEVIPSQIKRRKSIKSFLTVYDLIPILFPKFFSFNEVSKVSNTLKRLDFDSWIFCISNSTKIDLCNYLPNLDPSKIFVTYLAASDIFFVCSDPARLNSIRLKYSIPDAPYILSLSTLEPRKNIAHTIRCFLSLIQQENIPDLYLVLTGTKGWNYNAIFSEINSNPSLKNRIILTGFVPDEDLAPLYSGALAFVYPSFYEGFGLPPLEAMQCGVPVITSNTSSLPEVVGDAGLMVDPKDSDGLCQGIVDLYKQPSLRESMSQKSLIQAQKFSWENCTKQTISGYKTAVSS